MKKTKRSAKFMRGNLMEIMRTPDERFLNLPGYPFQPHYVEVDGLRMHYIDEGPGNGAPVLMLHGEPSWSYLYRKMIPVLVSAGLRAVAPDLVGFGRSDKPAKRDDYTYERHVNWTARFIQKLDLRGITLVCQDWGGVIGLRVAAEHSERFARIVAANTGLPTGEGPSVTRSWHGANSRRSIRLTGGKNDRGTRGKGLMVWSAGVGAYRRFVRRVGRSRTRAISKSEDSIRNGIDAGISANPQAS
jgi:pimeloyl-ACP methyl ester carboxylesterase